MSQPAVGMPPLRVVMRPVNHATFVVVGEFPVELDRVAFAYAGDARGQVDVVRNQQGPPAVETNDESLMTAAVIVIGKDAHYGAGAARLLTVAIACAALGNARRSGRRLRGLPIGRLDELLVQVDGCKYEENREYSFHYSSQGWDG
jgi:hypothetical protein